jgi:hypothetical protein
MGKKIHLCEYETNDLAGGFNSLFDSKVKIPRIKHGNKQTFDTLISEEAYLFAKFLRHERERVDSETAKPLIQKKSPLVTFLRHWTEILGFYKKRAQNRRLLLCLEFVF